MNEREVRALMELCLRQPPEKRERHLRGWLSPNPNREAQLIECLRILNRCDCGKSVCECSYNE